MEYQLLVGADAFWESLKKDAGSAKSSVAIQTLSFEGDSVGKMASELLLSLDSKVEVRVLIDSFNKYILNDKFLYIPRNYFNADLTAEKKSTRRMIHDLRESGVQVRFTSPVGLFFRRAAARNHKKIIVVDNRIAYIGGVNFSEHNFSWHDAMLRIEDPALVHFLQEDFDLTWNDKNYFRKAKTDGVEIFSLDGRSNESAFLNLFELIESAEKEIWVHSPYLSFPFVDVLKKAGKRGVAINVITPEANNRRFLKKYITWEASRSDLNLWFYQPRMSHLKAMLIDDRYLILGSTNFDYISYRVHPELIAIVTNPEIIREFTTRILDKDRAESVNGERPAPNFGGYLLKYRLLLLGKFFSRLSSF